jgi:hypothetical protein
MGNAIYTGEDVEVVVDLIDKTFASVTDVIIGVVVNKALKKTCKKTSTGATAVVVDPTNPNRCIFRLFRSETKLWEAGMLSLEVTVVTADVNFPAGRHNSFRENIIEFKNTLTKTS